MTPRAECPHKNLVREVAGLLHAEKPFDAARRFLEATKVKAEVDKLSKAYEILTQFLHWLLAENWMEEAASLLWTPNLFTPEPEATKRVWRAFDTQNYILLMGAASMSKSYSMGVRLMLEWIADPEYTNIQVLGPSEKHLKSNLFSHLTLLHTQSAIPLPGVCQDLFIGLDSKLQKGSILGVVVPLGKAKGAGRIQGTKRVQRRKAHPRYGPSARMFIFLDEIVNIPRGIWKDISNVMGNNQNDPHFKIIGAFNPTDPNDEVGKRVEPPFGWAEFDPDKHFEWMSKRKWWTVRLDAKYSENVVQKKIVYPGLQTYEGYNQIIADNGGMDSAAYWTQCRGCFPPLGASFSIIPGGMLNKFRGEFIWLDAPVDCAGVDLALQGMDRAIFAKGKFGLASGVKLPPDLQNPMGFTKWFKDERDRPTPRYALQLESLFPVPKGETTQTAEAIIRLCKQTHVKPAWLCMDRTGNGQGVYDTVKHLWGPEAVGVNFSEGTTTRKIMHEDSETPDKRFDRIQTELWFALRSFIEYDYLKGLFSLDTSELFGQLSQRNYRPIGKLSKVESKDDYQSRNQTRSPDEADALTLLTHIVRITGQLTLGMLPQNAVADGYGDEDDWDTQRVDATNRCSDVEE